MRFQVPQFIEVEDRIFGPLTIKQFIYLAGSAGFCFIIYRFIPSFFIAIILMLPVAGFGIALAFVQINKKPFIMTVEGAFKYYLGDKLYIWKKEMHSSSTDAKQEEGKKDISVYVPRLSDSKLKDLTWSLDINEHLGPGVQETKQGTQKTDRGK